MKRGTAAIGNTGMGGIRKADWEYRDGSGGMREMNGVVFSSSDRLCNSHCELPHDL